MRYNEHNLQKNHVTIKYLLQINYQQNSVSVFTRRCRHMKLLICLLLLFFPQKIN